MENNKIIMLAGEGDSTNILYHAVNSIHPIYKIIVEEKESKQIFLKRRIKRLGLLTVLGQVLFQLIIVKILVIISSRQIKKIVFESNLNCKNIPADKIVHVKSINDQSVKVMLQETRPDVVIVNGTRIISKEILNSVKCPFINTHTGITPMYRGVHGGYWALVKKDKMNCGVTVHLVDAGIDTGNVLFQKQIEVTKNDNFITYPYLQTAAAIPLLQTAIQGALQDNLHSIVRNGISKLWYHPTIWAYIYYRLFRNVK